jgi:hypothetical protein
MIDYIINDPWDWVTHFERDIAQYCGSKYAIACDSNSNAIRLVLHYLDIVGQEIVIPSKTYVSVPNQIILSGNKPIFEDYEWDGLYKFGGVPIVDAATAFNVSVVNNGLTVFQSFPSTDRTTLPSSLNVGIAVPAPVGTVVP